MRHNVVSVKLSFQSAETVSRCRLTPYTTIIVPIMKEHTLSVMTLEEYEPNREFVGRNFNAGEVVQLVLKSPSTGRWLPFNYVQMVMMHEYASPPCNARELAVSCPKSLETTAS